MYSLNDTDDLQKKRCFGFDWICLDWVSVCGGWWIWMYSLFRSVSGIPYLYVGISSFA
jgi:hypothetical protein